MSEAVGMVVNLAHEPARKLRKQLRVRYQQARGRGKTPTTEGVRKTVQRLVDP